MARGPPANGNLLRCSEKGQKPLDNDPTSPLAADAYRAERFFNDPEPGRAPLILAPGVHHTGALCNLWHVHPICKEREARPADRDRPRARLLEKQFVALSSADNLADPFSPHHLCASP